MRAPARELFRDADFPASDSSLFSSFSTPLAQFREDITWRRPQVGRLARAPNLGSGPEPRPGPQTSRRAPNLGLGPEPRAGPRTLGRAPRAASGGMPLRPLGAGWGEGAPRGSQSESRFRRRSGRARSPVQKTPARPRFSSDGRPAGRASGPHGSPGHRRPGSVSRVCRDEPCSCSSGRQGCSHRHFRMGTLDAVHGEGRSGLVLRALVQTIFTNGSSDK